MAGGREFLFVECQFFILFLRVSAVPEVKTSSIVFSEFLRE